MENLKIIRYKIIVSYDGSMYNGWQKQKKNVPTIQGVIEKIISFVEKKKTIIIASSRTDSKVHALGQVFHFDSIIKINSKKWKKIANSLLPKDIKFLSVRKVKNNFHSRFKVKKKIYEYYVNVGEYNVFLNNYVMQWRKVKKINISLIKKTCMLFEGEHDFGSFNTTKYTEVLNQIRKIYFFNVYKKSNFLIFRICGNGFLRKMVRMLVAACFYVSLKKYKIKKIKNLLNKPSKNSFPYVMEAKGLYLIKVLY